MDVFGLKKNTEKHRSGVYYTCYFFHVVILSLVFYFFFIECFVCPGDGGKGGCWGFWLPLPKAGGKSAEMTSSSFLL